MTYVLLTAKPETETILASVATPSEIVAEFALNESTVRKAISRGFPGRKSGGTWLMLRADAESRWSK